MSRFASNETNLKICEESPRDRHAGHNHDNGNHNGRAHLHIQGVADLRNILSVSSPMLSSAGPGLRNKRSVYIR